MPKLNYRKIPFGMALGHLHMDPADVSDFLTPNAFDAIEMPVECFLHETPEAHAKLSACKFSSISAGSLMERGLTRDIPFLAENYRRDFADQAELLLHTLAGNGLSSAILAFDMRRILGDDEAEAAALELVRRLAPVLYRLNFTLLIPYRIPFGGELKTAPLMAQFLRSTLSAQVKLSLEVHPFEIAAADRDAEVFGMLAFEAKQVVLVYDADCGNHLTSAQFKPWAEILEGLRYAGPYLLAPKSIRNRMSIPESDSFAKMVSDLRNE